MSDLQGANERAIQRYRKMVSIEATGNAVHVTLDGKHYVNDWDQFEEAMRQLIELKDQRK